MGFIFVLVCPTPRLGFYLMFVIFLLKLTGCLMIVLVPFPSPFLFLMVIELSYEIPISVFCDLYLLVFHLYLDQSFTQRVSP